MPRAPSKELEMPTVLAVAVGVTPVSWTVCGLWLLARKASPAPADAGAAQPARDEVEVPAEACGPLVAVPLAA